MFGATENAISPLPLPEEPEVMVTHAGTFETVQLHAEYGGADMFTLPVPPDAANCWLAFDRENEQETVDDCEIVN